MSRTYWENVYVLLGHPSTRQGERADLPRIATTYLSSYSRYDGAFPSIILQNGQSSMSSQSGWSLRPSNCEIWKLVIFAKVKEGLTTPFVWPNDDAAERRANGDRVNSAPKSWTRQPLGGATNTWSTHPLPLDGTPDNLELRRAWHTRKNRPSPIPTTSTSTHAQKVTSSSALRGRFSYQHQSHSSPTYSLFNARKELEAARVRGSSCPLSSDWR